MSRAEMCKNELLRVLRVLEEKNEFIEKLLGINNRLLTLYKKKQYQNQIDALQEKLDQTESQLLWFEDREAAWERADLETWAANKLQSWWWHKMLDLGLRDETYDECVARGGSGQGWYIMHNREQQRLPFCGIDAIDREHWGGQEHQSSGH